MYKAKNEQEALDFVDNVLRNNPKAFSKNGVQMDIKKAISECYKHQSSEDEIIIILEYKGKSNVACHPDFSEYFCKAVGYRWEDLRVGWKNFRGWHRTSLSAKSLRAELYEIILAAGINKYNYGCSDDVAFRLALSGNVYDLSQVPEIMYNYFLKKQESIKRFVTNLKLPKNVYAMKVGSVPVLDSYQQYRTGRCNKTPKTDIALIYDSGQIYQRVSLKKYTGKNNVGQGASCNLDEFNAVFKAVGIPENVKPLCEHLFSLHEYFIRNITRAEQKILNPTLYNQITQDWQQKNLLILLIFDAAPDFKREVITEHYSARKKFGCNSIGSADLILIFNEALDIIEYTSIEKYIDEHLDKILVLLGSKCDSNNRRVQDCYRVVYSKRADEKTIKMVEI